MGISNYVPSSRVSQAGVCTSTTRPASPYEGQMIYETDTNRVLVYDNTAWVMIADTDSPPGLELIKTDTITSGTSKEITGVFSSTYFNYRVVVSDMQISVLDNVMFRFGADNTAYYGSNYVDLHNGSGTQTNRSSNGAGLYVGIAENLSNNGAMTFDVFGPNSTQAHKGVHGTMWGGGYSGWFAGVRATSTSYTSFTLYTLNGRTFSSAKVAVYGYRQ